MHVVIELARAARAVVTEPKAFDRFDVQVKGSDDPVRLASAVDSLGIGQLIDDEILVRCEWLRSNADDGSANWTAGFTEMVAFAQRHGWLSADGLSIKAHVILVPEPGVTEPTNTDSTGRESTTSLTSTAGPTPAEPTPTDPTGPTPVE